MGLQLPVLITEPVRPVDSQQQCCLYRYQWVSVVVLRCSPADSVLCAGVLQDVAGTAIGIGLSLNDGVKLGYHAYFVYVAVSPALPWHASDAH
jgi:hypothetical protein